MPDLTARAPLPDWFFADGGALKGLLAQQLIAGEALEPQPADRFGAYSLTEEIGRGGQAIVFAAERADGAFSQRVAIKIALNADGMEFAQKRQLLAKLKHPNLARLLDGGELHCAIRRRPLITFFSALSFLASRLRRSVTVKCEAHNLDQQWGVFWLRQRALLWLSYRYQEMLCAVMPDHLLTATRLRRAA